VVHGPIFPVFLDMINVGLLFPRSIGVTNGNSVWFLHVVCYNDVGTGQMSGKTSASRNVVEIKGSS